MKTFDLSYISGPHGDECTTYDVKFKQKNLTIKEFINDIISNKEEWGCINIKVYDENALDYYTENEKFQEFFVKYKYGNIKDGYDVYRILENYIILQDDAWANGGWSCMNYWIKVKKN